MSNEAGRQFTDAEIAEWKSTGMINGVHYAAPLTPRTPLTHDQKVELYLKTIAWFTGIVAVAVIANFIAAIVIGVAAGARAYHGF